MIRPVLLSFLAIALSIGAARAEIRETVRVVGSSTVFPLVAMAAEIFGRTSAHKTPVVESTGSGGGFKVFCSGVGLETPDIVNASRRMTAEERRNCESRGVGEVVEIPLGFDGVVLAEDDGAERFSLTRRQLRLALAKSVFVEGAPVPNPFREWRDIDRALPGDSIRVYGPPPTSGTRDVLVDLVMLPPCPTVEGGPAERQAACGQMREDGPWIEAGEDDEMIVRRVVREPGALGIIGFNAFFRFADLVRAVPVEGVVPSADAIADGSYPLSRPLYLYVKKTHLRMVRGLAEFLGEVTSERAFGPDGYMTNRGLIPLDRAGREKARALAAGL